MNANDLWDRYVGQNASYEDIAAADLDDLTEQVAELDADAEQSARTIAATIKFYAAAQKYGKVSYQGQDYALTTIADFGNTLLPGGYTNYHEASDGESYEFDMAADAIDDAGNEYRVRWIFSAVKGAERELDSYDYSKPCEVYSL